jgi:indoleacetamide hydrolase
LREEGQSAPSVGTHNCDGGTLADLSAIEASRALSGGAITAESYAAALLERCRRYRHLNAFESLKPDLVLEAARAADRARASGGALGSLHGLPMVVKDNIDVAGYATSCGTPALAGQIAAGDAKLIRRLRREGAIVLGKSTMHELALGFGKGPGSDAINPYSPGMMTGGSSSGTAVALAARLTPLGLATDTGGSVRIPAAHCGVAGLRPTLGRYPSEGIVSLCPTRDTAGPMARSVSDLALLHSAICADDAGAQPIRLEGLRLGVPRRYFFEKLDPETAEIAERELDRLRSAGAVLIVQDLEGIAELNERVSFAVFRFEASARLRAHLARRRPGLSPEDFIETVASAGCRDAVRALLSAQKDPEDERLYRAAIDRWRPALQETYRKYFAANEVVAIVYPTTPLPAAAEGLAKVKLGAENYDSFLLYLKHVDPSSNAGIPGLTVLAGCNQQGLPVGLAFDGPEGSEKRLLSIGIAYEALRPWMPPPPGMEA